MFFSIVYFLFAIMLITAGDYRKTYLWPHFCKNKFRDNFNVKCPASGAKNMFCFLQNRLNWIWQRFITFIFVGLRNTEVLNLNVYRVALKA